MFLMAHENFYQGSFLGQRHLTNDEKQRLCNIRNWCCKRYRAALTTRKLILNICGI